MLLSFFLDLYLHWSAIISELFIRKVHRDDLRFPDQLGYLLRKGIVNHHGVSILRWAKRTKVQKPLGMFLLAVTTNVLSLALG